ncbi:hypothetical protein DAEQUDRAFT_763750 [Daedalea quercina L-15889]|uniref:Uncharacterized protein n=1 Tax=Daedalea quercina L-15889 TaxID=1314783 RepID=A0A165S4L4_9APHY|nr:hypothetical protein DAEQUDRAFT_763750 [Daedalea quercina L-15889]
MSRFGSVNDEEDVILDGENGGTFLVHREPDEEDEEEITRSDSPRTALLSVPGQSRDSLNLAERNSLRRPSRRDRERRRSSTYRELLRLLVSEDMEVKQSRRTLEVTLERLRGETQRAQLAEERALDLASRFKQVNDARITAQREVDRLSQELQLYKNEMEVARNELRRGEDLMKNLEAQRDDAEAVAARARSTARRLREQQLVTLAREDGRRMGFEEGLRRGFEEAGVTPPPRNARLPLGSQMQDEEDEDDDTPVLDLPSAPTVPPSDVDIFGDPGPSRRRQDGDYAATGAQGSRFTENMTPATMASVPLPDQRHSAGPQSWPQPPRVDEDGWPRPIPVQTASPPPHHPKYAVPPDSWVPSVDEDGRVLLPPPHEMSRPPPAPGQADDAPREQPNRPNPSAYRRPASPRSMTDSLPSTNMTMSDFDLLSAPRSRPSGRDRAPVLSAIPEAEFSPPSSDARGTRSGVMPEAFTFPAPARPESGYVGSDAGRRPVSRSSRRDDVSATGSSRRNPPIQDEAQENVRRSRANVQEWMDKQSPPESHRASPSPAQRPRYQSYVTDVPEDERLPSPYERPPSSATGSASRHRRSRSGSLNRPSVPPALPIEHRRGHSSDESIKISIQLPSGSGSSMVSPSAPLESGKLTPAGSVRRSQTPQPVVLPVFHSPNMRNVPSTGAGQAVPQLPPGFIPTGAPQVTYNQPAPPMPGPAYASPRSAQRRLYPQAGLEDGPVVPMMPSTSSSSSGSKSRPPRSAPAPALTRVSSRASGSMSYEMPGSRPKTPSTKPPTQPAASRPITPAQTGYGPAPSRPYTPTGSPRMIPAPAPATSIYPDGSRWSPRPNDTPLPVPGPTEMKYIPAPASPRMVPAPAVSVYPADGSRWSPRPGGIQLPSTALSPRSSTSRLSLAGGGGGHQRSLSLNAGSTPAALARPLSRGAMQELRRVPSASSVASRQSGYKPYDPSQYRDVSDLASNEDLPRMIAPPSPGAWADARQNAGLQLGPADAPARSTSVLSYVSSGHIA